MTEKELPNSDRASKTLDESRRSFLSTSSSVIMAGGLAASYGTLFVMAGRYVYPSGTGKAWMFVTDAASLAPGQSMPYESPTGVPVTITRRAESPRDQVPPVEDFQALSSVCPHLGCRVSWEPHNDRFYCPCHNGVFNSDGSPRSGPPAADGQHLPQYALRIEDGALFIEMPTSSVGKTS